MMEIERADGAADQLDEQVGRRHPVGQPLPERRILGIDLDCGVVESVVDASSVTAAATGGDRVRRAATRCADPRRAQRDRLAGTGAPRRHYYVTGKRWPTLYEITFAPA